MEYRPPQITRSQGGDEWKEEQGRPWKAIAFSSLPGLALGASAGAAPAVPRSGVRNVRCWWRARVRQPQVPHALLLHGMAAPRAPVHLRGGGGRRRRGRCRTRCICVVVDGEAVGPVPTYRLLGQALLIHRFPRPLRALLPVAMAAGRRHAGITASQGWTVFDLPSTPRCLESVRSATCG